jgi:integrase
MVHSSNEFPIAFQESFVKVHSLRQAFGTRLGMAGTDLGTIQELMGHAGLKMTKRYYHLTATHKREAGEMLDGVTTFFTTRNFVNSHFLFGNPP